MSRALPFLLARVFNTPLLVVPARLDAFLVGLPALLGARGNGTEDAPPIDALLQDGDGAPPPDAQPRRGPGYSIRDGVATLPLHGVLVRRAGQMTPDCTPLMSYETIAKRLQSAVRNPAVRGIMLDIDSPGGEAGGVFDLAREIRRTDAIKPVWASANDDAFSAAYALASGARRIWTTGTGGLGSIGVVALHADQSLQDAREGLRYSYVHAGARKIDGHPHAPLSPEAHARIQTEVDRLHEVFVKTVAEHRRLTQKAVRATEAGLYFGPEAKAAGLADEVGTPEEAARALAAHVAPVSRRPAAMSEHSDTPAPQAAAPQGAVEAAPPPAPPAQPAPAAAPDATVVTFAAAHRQGGERAAAIMELCLTANRPQIAAELVRGDLTIEQVQRHLLDLAAAAAAAAVVIPISTETPVRAGPPLPKPITSAESFAFMQQQRS